MSQELANVVIVEDDDYMYGKMLPFLHIPGINIERTISRRWAMNYVKKSQNRVFWIIDGNFPKFDHEKVETMWPSLVRIIQEYGLENMNMVWFTSDPKIFAWIDIPVFDKQYFSSSMWKIVEHILKAQKS
jgi:hypothetical protein